MKLIDEEGIIKLRNLIKSDIQEVRDEIPDFPKDTYPIEGSHNPIESGGVYDALADKQDVLTFDNTPTANSENPVKSGGVYQVVTGKQDRLTFDEVPTLGSQNMVRSGAIALALNNKNDMATPVDTISSSVDNPVKSSAIYEALQGKQDTLTFDTVPTEGSDNVVSSRGIYEALSRAGSTPDWSQYDSEGVGYIKNRTHYINYTFGSKLADVVTIAAVESNVEIIVNGESYRQIYCDGPFNGELYAVRKYRVTFAGRSSIIDATVISGINTMFVDYLGLYIRLKDGNLEIYVNWLSPSATLTIEPVSESYHKLSINYLDIETSPKSGSSKPISSNGVYTALQTISGELYASINLKENLSNKVTTINAESTDDKYPSALAVWTLIHNMENTINNLTQRIIALEEGSISEQTSAAVEDDTLEVFNGSMNGNILELDGRSYVDENNILNFANSASPSSSTSIDNNMLSLNNVSVNDGILELPDATMDGSTIDLG